MPCDLTELQAMLARRERTEKLTALRKAVQEVTLQATFDFPQVRGDLEAVEARVTRALAAAMQAEADAYPKGERS